MVLVNSVEKCEGRLCGLCNATAFVNKGLWKDNGGQINKIRLIQLIILLELYNIIGYWVISLK